MILAHSDERYAKALQRKEKSDRLVSELRERKKQSDRALTEAENIFIVDIVRKSGISVDELQGILEATERGC